MNVFFKVYRLIKLVVLKEIENYIESYLITRIFSYPYQIVGVPNVHENKLIDVIKSQHNTFKSNLNPRFEDNVFFKLEAIFDSTIYELIKYVHLLPASESHHHAAPYGLIKHSLDVARKSIDIYCESNKKTMMDDDYNNIIVIWLLGLFHDIGKVHSDIQVTNLTGNIEWTYEQGPLVRWLKNNNIKRYKYNYRIGRKHTLHNSKNIKVFTKVLQESNLINILPKLALNQCKELLSLDGEHTFIRIVKAADAISTRNNIVSSNLLHISLTKNSLAELCLISLRKIISQSDIDQRDLLCIYFDGDLYISDPLCIYKVIEDLRNVEIQIPINTKTVKSILLNQSLVNSERTVKYCSDKKILVNLDSAINGKKYIKLNAPLLKFELISLLKNN